MVLGFSLASAIAPLMSLAAKPGCAKISSGDDASRLMAVKSLSAS